jgi:hypothetical protein
MVKKLDDDCEKMFNTIVLTLLTDCDQRHWASERNSRIHTRPVTRRHAGAGVRGQSMPLNFKNTELNYNKRYSRSMLKRDFMVVATSDPSYFFAGQAL